MSWRGLPIEEGTEGRPAAPAPATCPASAPAPEGKAPRPAKTKRKKPVVSLSVKQIFSAGKAAAEVRGSGGPDKVANQSIRSNVDTLETPDEPWFSAGVDPEKQMLEISRRNEETEFKVPLQRLLQVTARMQEGVMKTRMQPIGNAWRKLRARCANLSGRIEQAVELEMHGADTELDRQVARTASRTPLNPHGAQTHADNGLETPAERSAYGKPGRAPSALRLSRGRTHHSTASPTTARGLNTERIKARSRGNGLARGEK